MSCSGGTGLIDCSAPKTSDKAPAYTLYSGNYIIAKVNSVSTVLTSAELLRLLKAGYDVEIVVATSTP
jgi:hypothetical protein